MHEEKLLFLDTETASVKRDGGIIQLAGFIEVDGEEKESFNYLVAPIDGVYIDPKTLEFHETNNHWTKENIMNFRPAGEVFKEFTALLGKYVSPYNKQDKYTIVGYNAYFDTEQLRKMVDIKRR